MKRFLVLFFFGVTVFAQGDPPQTNPYLWNNLGSQSANPDVVTSTGHKPLVNFADSYPSSLVILDKNGEMLISISTADGNMTFGKNYKADVAAKAFWDAVKKYVPCTPAPAKEQK